MITANEARELTKQGKQDTCTKLIASIEHAIKQTAGDGGRHIYTEGLLPKEAVKHFEAAGFTVEKEKRSVFFDSYTRKVHRISW